MLFIQEVLQEKVILRLSKHLHPVYQATCAYGLHFPKNPQSLTWLTPPHECECFGSHLMACMAVSHKSESVMNGVEDEPQNQPICITNYLNLRIVAMSPKLSNFVVAS